MGNCSPLVRHHHVFRCVFFVYMSWECVSVVKLLSRCHKGQPTLSACICFCNWNVLKLYTSWSCYIQNIQPCSDDFYDMFMSLIFLESCLDDSRSSHKTYRLRRRHCNAGGSKGNKSSTQLTFTWSCVVVITHVPLIDLHMPDLIIKGRNFQKYSDQLTTPNDFLFFLNNVISFYVSIFIST